MQCPKCGNQNPDDAQSCRACHAALTNTDTQEPKAKTSKNVVGAVFLAGLSLILTICVKPTLAFLAAMVGAVAIVVSIVQTIKGKKKLTIRRIGLGLFIILQMVLLTYWRIDAAPIPNDYTINDLRSATLRYNDTYSLFQSLADHNENSPDAPAIGLSSEELKNLEEINNIFKEKDLKTISKQLQANADKIMSIWQNAKKGRDIFDRLEKCPEIADLTEPYLESRISWALNFKHLIFLTRAYICLQSYKGNHKAAIDELSRLDSISKKISLNARMLITKLVCLAYLRINIETANFIINNPETPKEVLLVLKQRMIPFSNEHVSLRNPMIFEYLTFKNELKKITHEPRFRYSYFPPLKLNSTLRLYRNFCDKWISVSEHRTRIKEFRVWPTLYANLPAKIGLRNKLPWYYKAYNPAGSYVAYILMPGMEKVFEIKTRMQIYSDLLQIAFNKRLGREADLKARAYSDQYIIDIENRIIFSPGPDGQAGTDDDIKLPINPEVLGFTE